MLAGSWETHCESTYPPPVPSLLPAEVASSFWAAFSCRRRHIHGFCCFQGVRGVLLDSLSLASVLQLMGRSFLLCSQRFRGLYFQGVRGVLLEILARGSGLQLRFRGFILSRDLGGGAFRECGVSFSRSLLDLASSVAAFCLLFASGLACITDNGSLQDFRLWARNWQGLGFGV